MSNQTPQPIADISVTELASRLATGTEGLQLVDVRESEEVETASLNGFENFPLSQFAEWSPHIHERLDPHVETLVLCHHGMRSAQMCQWLVNQGFTHVRNIQGGIHAYAVGVDPTMPRY